MTTEQLPSSRRSQPNRPIIIGVGRGLGIVLGIAISTGVSSWLVGNAISSVAGNRNELWLLARAAGITSYLLLVLLVPLGLVLSHPWRTRVRRPIPATRIRIHVTLAVFTLVFTILHILVLVNDKWAGVGVRGALLPMAATYRPLAVTLGLIGLYSGLLSGLTAILAGRITARIWWPIHKVASISLVLIWIHGVLAGSDSATLQALYYITAIFVIALAATRYTARTPADLISDLKSRGERLPRR